MTDIVQHTNEEDTPVKAVKRRLKPMKDLTQIKKELIEWLDNNPPWYIPSHERPHALLTLSLLIDKIHDWGMKNRSHQEDLEKLQ